MELKKHQLHEREIAYKEQLNNITTKHEKLRYNCEAMKMRTLAKQENIYTQEEIIKMYPFWHENDNE